MLVFASKFECADHKSEKISLRSPSVRPQYCVKVGEIYVKKAYIFQKIKNDQIFWRTILLINRNPL
jgi:hypothetical protein